MNQKKGIISTIVIIIIALILLKVFFDVDIIEFIKKPEVQEILQKIWSYIWEGLQWAWNSLVYLWSFIRELLNKAGL